MLSFTTQRVSSHPTSHEPTTSDLKFSVTIASMSGAREVIVRVKPSTKVGSIRRFIAQNYDMCEDSVGIMYEGLQPDDHVTFSRLGVKEGDVIEWRVEQRGGKPVIYIMPPRTSPAVAATVELALSGSWSLSAIYPLHPDATRGNRSYGQKTSWAVQADSNGVLRDKATGAEVSYLYWEAMCELCLISALICTLTLPTEPIRPVLFLHPSCSVIHQLSQGSIHRVLDYLSTTQFFFLWMRWSRTWTRPWLLSLFTLRRALRSLRASFWHIYDCTNSVPIVTGSPHS